MASAERHWHPNFRHASTLPVALQRTGVPDLVRAWVQRHCRSPVVRVSRLAGASTTAVHMVWLANGLSFVLRRYAWSFVLVDEPVISRLEVNALEWCAKAGLPAPRVVAVDLDGSDVGDGVPVLLMTRVPGRSRLAAPEAPMAEVVAQIHAAGVSGLDFAFHSWVDPDRFAVPPGGDAGLWRTGFAAWLAGPPTYDSVYIHRDFHPGNVIWHRQRISGVVDWAHGCAGPAGKDLSTCWWNLIDQAGLARAEEFVREYERLTGSATQWFWMLDGLMSPNPSDWQQVWMVETEPALRLVLGRLS